LADGRVIEYQPWVPPDRGFYVYRAWASDGGSVYVGMVGAKGPGILAERLRHHEMTAGWWPLVARIDWAELGSTREALDEETRQIAEHGPIWNRKRPRLPEAACTAASDAGRPASPKVSGEAGPPMRLPELGWKEAARRSGGSVTWFMPTEHENRSVYLDPAKTPFFVRLDAVTVVPCASAAEGAALIRNAEAFTVVAEIWQWHVRYGTDWSVVRRCVPAGSFLCHVTSPRDLAAQAS